MTYDDLDDQLTGRCRERRKIANNTWAERRGDAVAVRLHDTDILTFHRDGRIVFDTGGWFTVTTKERMNRYTPAHIWSEQGVWFVNGEPYADGCTLHPDGTLTGTAEQSALDRQKKLRSDINRWVRSITPEQVVDAFDNHQGDCFLCRFGQTYCVPSHLEEHYFHAHLVKRAVEDAGYRSPDAVLSMIYHDAQRGQVADDFLRRPLRKYLKKHILEGVAA